MLRSRAALPEWEFRSSLPIVGGIISAFRRGVFAISSKWAVRSVVQHQSAFNNQLVELLEQIQRENARAWERSAEHVENLENQCAEIDRVMLETRRDLAVLRLEMMQGIAALEARAAEIQRHLADRDHRYS